MEQAIERLVRRAKRKLMAGEPLSLTMQTKLLGFGIDISQLEREI
jgi:hypothetical protein